MTTTAQENRREEVLTTLRALAVGDEMAFGRAPSNPYRLTGYRYDYEEAATRCPACETGSGVPWGGWFACGNCPAISFIATGQVFLPAIKTLRSAVLPTWDVPKRDPYNSCGWVPQVSEALTELEQEAQDASQ